MDVTMTPTKVKRRVGARLLVVLALIVGACSTPVGVRRVEEQEAHNLLTANVLSSGTPSSDSLQVLVRQDLLAQFEQDPAAALATLRTRLQTTNDSRVLNNRLFALAELSFLHAEQRKGRRAGQSQQCLTQKGKICWSGDELKEADTDRAYYLAAAVYAYAFLFPDDPRDAPRDPADPRLRLAYDLYNRGLAEGLGTVNEEEVALVSGLHPLPFGTLEIESTATTFSWAGYRLEHFVPAANLAVRGLSNRYRRPGIGAPLAASLAGATDAPAATGSNRIPLRLKVPVTTFLRLDHPRAQLSNTVLHGQLELYAPDLVDTVIVDGQPRPLEFEPTAALAYTLETSRVYDLEIAGFLRDALRTYIPKSRTQDGLFFLQPPSVDRIPVVLVHGTASSPARWAELINELEGDPRIRSRYQIWLFIYEIGRAHV